MNNNTNLYNLIEKSQDEWSGTDMGLHLKNGIQNGNNKPDRNDTPSDLKFVETMISNWFENNRTVLVSVNDITSLFPELGQQQKQELISEIQRALETYYLSKNVNQAQFELNLDSFNNVLFCSGVQFAKLITQSTFTVYLTKSKSIFAKNVYPHQIFSILNDKNVNIKKEFSIHIKIIKLLHSKMKFVSKSSLTTFIGSNCLRKIGNIYFREVKNKFSGLEWFKQVPKDDILYVMNLQYTGSNTYTIRDYDVEIQGITDWVTFMNENHFYNDETPDVIFAYLFFSVLFLEWSGDKRSLHRLIKSFNIQNDEWSCIEETLKESLELKCICSSVMCQSSGANMSTSYAKRADVGHRLASNHLLILLKKLDSVLVNNVALSDSGVEHRDVNQWHLTRYVPFFGSKLWGNWYIRNKINTTTNTERANIFQELSNIQAEYFKENIKQWFKNKQTQLKEYDFIGPPYPKLTIPPYDVFISGYVDKITRVLKYKHCHSFNWIGREGGLPFVTCIKCGEPVVFDRINKQRNVKLCDIYSFDGRLSWFLPFLAIVHDDCILWKRELNLNPISQKDQEECWSMLRNFWRIFTDAGTDHYTLYYNVSDYSYLSKNNKRNALNGIKNRYRARNVSASSC